MYELTLHVQPVGTENFKEIITVESNFMSDKIAHFLEFVTGADFQNGRYYDAVLSLEVLENCSKGLDILLNMKLEPFMRRQVWRVFQLIEELRWEIEGLEAKIEDGLYDGAYLCWRYE